MQTSTNVPEKFEFGFFTGWDFYGSDFFTCSDHSFTASTRIVCSLGYVHIIHSLTWYMWSWSFHQTEKKKSKGVEKITAMIVAFSGVAGLR